MSGGRGNDVFIFNAALNASTNVDRIQDFNASNDTFQLDDAVFTGLTAGMLAAGAFALSSSMGDADDRVIYDRSTGNLFFDANGGARDNLVQFAKLDNNVTINANDFFVI